MIVVMAGLPASGKSTLCGELSARLNGTVLDKDKFRSAMFAERDIEYSTTQDDLCMEVIFKVAAHILGRDPSRYIFIDGRPFSRTYQIAQVLEIATALQQELRILECVCSDETARERLADFNNHPAGNRNYELYLRVKREFEEIKFAKLVIDTDQSLDVCIERGMIEIVRDAL